MAIPITVPRLGWTMEEGTFIGWLKKDGEPVRRGEALFTLEGEKAAEDIEAFDEGVLRIGPDAPEPGAIVKVGAVLAYLVGPNEAAPVTSVSAPVPATSTARVAKPASPIKKETARREHPAISPRARRVARELGIDWLKVAASGRTGRIRERDIRRASQTTPGTVIPHTRLRQVLAARMVAGVTQAAPVTLTTDVDATELVALRQRLREAASSAQDAPGYTELFVKCVALLLRKHPLLQAQWRPEGLFLPAAVNIAVAVDTEAGLFAPVLRDADRLSLAEVRSRLREMIERARSGKLSAADQRDGTFTITNLGRHGIDAFTPIIDLPQCAVLGLGCIKRRPAVVGDTIVPREQMVLSLTFDHRIVDGAPAARFLAEVREWIEQPDWLSSAGG